MKLTVTFSVPYHNYQFNYTPFVTETEVSVVPQNFSGVGYVDWPDFFYMNNPDPTNPSFGELMSRLKRDMDMASLCYYGGLNFEYTVENGALTITYPGCIYAFYLGHIIDSTMKENDILRLDGSEKILDIYGTTVAAEERISAYDDYDSLLTVEQCYQMLNDWVSAHWFPVDVFVSTYAYYDDLVVEGGIFAPYGCLYLDINQQETLSAFVHLRTGRINIIGYEDSIDTWYAQRFG